MELYDIIESYNTRQNLHWVTDGITSTTHFQIEDEKYDIVINHYDIELPTRESSLNVDEISFGRYDVNNKRLVSLTPSQHPSKVFGTIYNGVLDTIMIKKPDIIVFSAKNINDNGDTTAFSKRIKLYNLIAQRINATGLYSYLNQPIKTQLAENFLLFRTDVKLQPDELDWIKQNIK